mgnify:CR=1 FL=1
MAQIAIGLLTLGAGLALMILSADKAVKHGALIAASLGVSPFMIGLVVVSLGTDLPEIANSIESCALGHGDLALGDAVGSVFTQLTLVLGLLPLLGSPFRVQRKQILVTGTCQLLALVQVISIVEKGHISRSNALALVASWPLYMLLVRAAEPEHVLDKLGDLAVQRSRLYHASLIALGLVGVGAGAYIVIQSAIRLSAFLQLAEYLVSFFIVSLGTSLPELVVDLAALRRREYEIAIGDLMGSCIVDATLSIGIGQVFFPQSVSGALARSSIAYMLLATAIVVTLLAWRRKLEKKAGAVFIGLYLASYALLAL